MVVYIIYPSKMIVKLIYPFIILLSMICELQINIEIFPICVLFSASDSKSKFGFETVSHARWATFSASAGTAS